MCEVGELQYVVGIQSHFFFVVTQLDHKLTINRIKLHTSISLTLFLADQLPHHLESASL